jgi:hypothetical protein
LKRVVIVVTVRWSRMEQLAVDVVDARWLSTAVGRWCVYKCGVQWLRVCVLCAVVGCVWLRVGLCSMCAEWGVKRGCGGLGRSRGLRPNDATSGREHARSRTHPVPTLHEDHLHMATSLATDTKSAWMREPGRNGSHTQILKMCHSLAPVIAATC